MCGFPVNINDMEKTTIQTIHTSPKPKSHTDKKMNSGPTYSFLHKNRKKLIIVSIIAIVIVAIILLIPTNHQLSIDQSDGIIITSGEGEYSDGSLVSLDAEVEEGYTFIGWFSGNELRSTSPTYQFNINSDEDLYAKAGITRSVDINLGKGIDSVTGAGYYGESAQITISADPSSDYSFYGWFSDGTKLSSASTYTLTVNGDIEINARSECDCIYTNEYDSFTFKCPIESSGTVTWMIIDKDTGRIATTLNGSTASYNLSYGTYVVKIICRSIDGISYEHSETITSDIVVKEFRWVYNGQSYGITWKASVSAYNAYSEYNLSGRHQINDSSDAAFVEYDSDVIESFTSTLSEESQYMTDLERANFVLKFVQSTKYITDEVSKGVGEYWKYPYETLYDDAGDCEDTAILYAALMKALGYNVVLLLYSELNGYVDGHMATGVNVLSAHGTYYLIDGLKYYYCETTSNTMNVGDEWDKYDTAHIIRIP